MVKKYTKAYDKALLAAHFSSEQKGQNITLMDMRVSSSLCDWFVIVSASSARRIKTIIKSVDRGLAQKGIKSLRVEGRQNDKWVILDYGDIVIHVFAEEIREFYELEELWDKAPKIEYSEAKCAKKTSQTRSRK